VRSTGNGYAVTATGQSNYGPFVAELTILTGQRLTLDIRRLTLAGFTFSGRVVQTAAGPFAGTLKVSGSGIDGSVRLSAEGQYQRADLAADATGARIPGEVPISVQRGIIRATAILYPSAPSITADIQLAGVRSGQLMVRQARARINYRGGQGGAQLVAEGSSSVPFKVAANAALSPDLIRVAAQGAVNGIDFHLAQPAALRKTGAGWQLGATTIVLPQGNVRLAGRVGDGLVLESRFDRLDLSILNAFLPNMGLGGQLSGSLDFAQPSGASFPRAEARLTVSNFTRTGVAVRSAPVDIASVAKLGPDGGTMAAVIRRGDAVIGRTQLRLQPLSPAAGSWMTRLLASPLGGGIRYNGPAEILWSLTGMADQQLSGPIGIAADFSGRVQDPRIVGVIRANRLGYVNESYGTRITDIALQGRFTSSRLEITQLSGRAGEGSVTGHGTVDLASQRGYPIDISLTLDRARLARSDALGATASGTISITNSAARGALISGELRLPEARYQIVRQGAAEVAVLEGVRRKGEPLPRAGEEQGSATPSIWKLDLRVRADNEVYISGMGLESEWSTNLRVTGTSASPIVTGRAQVLRGTYSFGGRRFDLDRGIITFTGGQPVDPELNISASTEVDNITATLSITGTANNPQIALSSSPSLPQDEILARLFFGSSVTDLSATQALQLAASLNTLRGSGGGLNPLGKLRAASGLDRLRILGADEATGRGTAIAAGVHISNDIYVEIITDARGFTATQMEIALSKSLSILSQVGSFGTSNFSIRYSKDY
jgi:translocation and assembly module TamB